MFYLFYGIAFYNQSVILVSSGSSSLPHWKRIYIMLLITTRGGYGKLLANLTSAITVDNYTKMTIDGKQMVFVSSEELTRVTGKKFKKIEFIWTIGNGAEFI